VQAERLKIKRTATNYWVVERGAEPVSGATTRKAAEAERDMLNSLRERVRRVSGRGRARIGAANPAGTRH
jgi:hypothetical protein